MAGSTVVRAAPPAAAPPIAEAVGEARLRPEASLPVRRRHEAPRASPRSRPDGGSHPQIAARPAAPRVELLLEELAAPSLPPPPVLPPVPPP
jgi:hypothetical protein